MYMFRPAPFGNPELGLNVKIQSADEVLASASSIQVFTKCDYAVYAYYMQGLENISV